MQNGHYWVRIHNYNNRQWTIATYRDGSWFRNSEQLSLNEIIETGTRVAGPPL